MSQPDPARRPTPGQDATLDRGGATRVGLAAAVAAGTSTLIVLGAPAVLADTADTTAFLTFWSALFACFGLLSGISVETTRAVAAVTADGARTTEAARRPRAGVVGAVVGLALGVVVGVAAPLWGPAVFPRSALPFAVLVAVGVAGYAVHSVVVGALAGAGRWTVYARVIAADSLVRLVLVAGLAVLAVAALGSAAVAGAAGAAAAAFTWAAAAAVSPTVRAAAATRVDVPWGPLLRRLGAASTATGASALLVVGFPTLLAATTPTTEYQYAAPLILALTLTRAPLLIPLNAYQGVAVAHVVRNRDRGLGALLPVVRVVAVVGAAGAAAAWLVGPWLLAVIGRGEGYRLDGGVLAGLTLGATGIALLTLTGAVCQALARHGAYVAGWLVAVGAAVLLLLLPLPLETRTVLALCTGPVAGGLVHLVALRGASRGQAGSPPAPIEKEEDA